MSSILNETQTSEELLNDLKELFDLESFGKTLEILRGQISNTYVKDFNKFLKSILQFKIHRFKCKSADKYVNAIKRKISINIEEKISAKKFGLFLNMLEPLLKFAKDGLIEIVNADGTISPAFDRISIAEYIKHGLNALQPLSELPSVLQVTTAIDVIHGIEAEAVVFKIATIKEKISLLTRYSQELIKSIEILQKQIDLKDKKERNQIDKLKTKQRSVLVELSTNIGLLSGLYCQIQANTTIQEDTELIDELFSMNLHIAAPSIDPIFIEIVEIIMKQIVNKPTSIKVGPVINELISDADLSYFKKKELSSDAMQILQRAVIMGSNIIDMLSLQIPKRYKREHANGNLNNIPKQHTTFTRSLLLSEILLEIGYLINSAQILKYKNSEINQKVVEMHKKIIEEIFKFLGEQVEIDATIQSLHNQYQIILDTTALHNQGIKSDTDYYSELYIMYDKILSLYKSKMALMDTYSKIRAEYNLPSQIATENFKKSKVEHSKQK